MRLPSLLLLAVLAACDLPLLSDAPGITPLSLRSEAAPAGTEQVVTLAGEPGRIVVRGVFDVPAANRLDSYSQRRGSGVTVFVRASDYPPASTPAGPQRYEATLSGVPRGTYSVWVHHYVHGDPTRTMRTAVVDTVAVR